MKKRRVIGAMAALWCGATVVVQAGTLQVDKQASWVKVDAKATGHAFSGNLESYEAAVTGDDATLLPKTAVLRWNFSDLKTGDAKRDTEMLKWLEHAKSPKGEFRMNKTWQDKDGKTHAQGVLKIHDVAKTVSFPVSAKRDGKRVVIDGNVWLDYQDFSLPIIRAMVVMTVDPKLNVRFHLEGESR